MDSPIPIVVPSPDAEPHIHRDFEDSTQTWQWIVADPDTKSAIIINPVLDHGPKHHGISTTAADRLLNTVRQHGYRVVRILETHGLRSSQTSAWYLRAQLRDADGHMPRICTGKSIVGVQRMFARQYRIEDAGWARHFDSSFRDDQIFNFGHLQCQVLQVDITTFAFLIGNNIFLGEIPDEGRRLRLQGLTPNDGYRWHPDPNDSRPTTSTTDESSVYTATRSSMSGSVGVYSPLALSSDSKEAFTSIPPSAVHEMAG